MIVTHIIFSILSFIAFLGLLAGTISIILIDIHRVQQYTNDLCVGSIFVNSSYPRFYSECNLHKNDRECNTTLYKPCNETVFDNKSELHCCGGPLCFSLTCDHVNCRDVPYEQEDEYGYLNTYYERECDCGERCVEFSNNIQMAYMCDVKKYDVTIEYRLYNTDYVYARIKTLITKKFDTFIDLPDITQKDCYFENSNITNIEYGTIKRNKLKWFGAFVLLIIGIIFLIVSIIFCYKSCSNKKIGNNI